jgi:hypothetical protein
MRNRRIPAAIQSACLALLLPAIVPSAQVAAAEKADERAFLRLQRDDEGEPWALETSLVRYSPRSGGSKTTVDLVAAVHVGDAAYYTRLNELFDEYDVVLYELVAPPEAQVPTRGDRKVGVVSSVQLGMKNVLDLEFQLDCIDYAQENMCHADLTPAEFARSMQKRGESFAQWFVRMLGESLAMQVKKPATFGDAALLAALISKDRPIQLKRLLARQFEASEGSTTFDGEQGSTLITERNKRALAELSTQIKAGKRKIAIFYGAAHMADMERKLTTEFGLKRTETRWLPAWNLTATTPAETKKSGKSQ